MRMATDNAVMQRENTKISTRVLDKGTKINMYFGETVISGTLNVLKPHRRSLKSFLIRYVFQTTEMTSAA